MSPTKREIERELEDLIPAEQNNLSRWRAFLRAEWFGADDLSDLDAQTRAWLDAAGVDNPSDPEQIPDYVTIPERFARENDLDDHL